VEFRGLLMVYRALLAEDRALLINGSFGGLYGPFDGM